MKWTGVFPAVTTQFKQDGTLDLDATQVGIERLIDGGVSGLVMMGMVGENSSLRSDEKLRVLRAALESSHGRVLCALYAGELRHARQHWNATVR